MKVKLTHIILIIYLILISFITKKFQLIPFSVFILWFLIENYFSKNAAILSKIDKLVYLLIAFLPFPYLLLIFVLYLPFAIFGMIF